MGNVMDKTNSANTPVRKRSISSPFEIDEWENRRTRSPAIFPFIDFKRRTYAAFSNRRICAVCFIHHVTHSSSISVDSHPSESAGYLQSPRRPGQPLGRRATRL